MSNQIEVVYEYVEELDPNLTCVICQTALVDPVTTTSCKHTFCRDCIERAIATNAQCPIDRSALSGANLRETEQLVRLMLDELQVRCTEPNCGKTMQRGLLLGHLKHCPKGVVMCSTKECGLSMERHRMPHHRAYDCFQRRMACERCDQMLVFQTAGSHSHSADDSAGSDSDPKEICDMCNEPTLTKQHRWTCPSSPIPCPHAELGCSSTPLRSALPTHLLSCTYEALSPLLAAHRAELDSLHAALDAQAATHAAQINALRLELVDVHSTRYIGPDRDLGRRARNPYAHLMRHVERESAGGLGTGEVGGGPEGGSGQGRGEGDGDRSGDGTGVATEPGEGEGVALDTSSSPPDPSRVPLADLPPPSPDNPRPRVTSFSRSATAATTSGRNPAPAPAPPTGPLPPRSLFTPSFGSHQRLGDWAFQRLGHTGYSLDPARLARTVAELREVVLHLASAMDNMERRHEVRTMTETLRVLEDVGALRAHVNTIRTQVMMDRPAQRLSSAPPTPTPLASIISHITPSPASPPQPRSPTSVSHPAQGPGLSPPGHGLPRFSEPILPRLSPTHPSVPGQDETASITESVAYSVQGTSVHGPPTSVVITSAGNSGSGAAGGAPSSSGYAAAIRALGARNAQRAAAARGAGMGSRDGRGTVGHVGGQVGRPGQPMGLPGMDSAGVEVAQGDSAEEPAGRTGSRLGRVVSMRFGSMRSLRPGNGHTPRL